MMKGRWQALLAALELPEGTRDEDVIAEAARLRARVSTQDRLAKKWQAENPERTRELNRAAAKRYRARKRAEREA
jgi:hypothetical protein